MKKWLRTWLYSDIENTTERYDSPKPMPSNGLGSGRMSGHVQSESGLNCRLFKASGGYIVEFNNYNPMTDRNNNSLHVISNDDDFGNSFSKIVTVELMRL
jgi:hypothetical protein